MALQTLKWVRSDSQSAPPVIAVPEQGVTSGAGLAYKNDLVLFTTSIQRARTTTGTIAASGAEYLGILMRDTTGVAGTMLPVQLITPDCVFAIPYSGTTVTAFSAPPLLPGTTVGNELTWTAVTGKAGLVTLSSGTTAALVQVVEWPSEVVTGTVAANSQVFLVKFLASALKVLSDYA